MVWVNCVCVSVCVCVCVCVLFDLFAGFVTPNALFSMLSMIVMGC